MTTKNAHRNGYKLTTLGWIPEEWGVDLLDKLAKRGSGHTPNKTFDKYYNGGIKWVSLADSCRLDNGYIHETANNISEEGLMNSSAVLHPKGTILLSRDAGVGKSAVMAIDMAVSQHFITWTCNGQLDNWFLYYFLQSKKEYFERHAVGSTIKTIGLPLFKRLEIVKPPLTEQRRIAEILFTWDDAIIKTQQFIKILEKRQKGLAHVLLTKRKRLNGFKGKWRKRELGSLFTERVETGYVWLPLLSIGSLGVYPQSESEKRDNSNEDKSKYKRICPGDIGYNTMRMWQGRSAFSSLEGLVSPAYTIITPNKGEHSLFYSFLFKTPFIINKFFRNSQGLVEDTLNCKFKDFSIIKVNTPNYDEQVAIAKVLQKSEESIKLYKIKMAALQQQKKGLMQKLLTGEVRVTKS
ncbi:MAG TPA: restriction endonuclease subunit S [Puia sp.]|nr:restriction endonuclease subunit S [Puia sp.]